MNDIPTIRLYKQQISAQKFTTAKQLVSWMGALQAQDFIMSKWAIGLRVPGSDDKMIEEALDKGEILRTHILRPTWHIVAAEDIRWMLQLTAPGIIASMKSRERTLELSDKVYSETNRIISKALENGQHLSKDELQKEFELKKINTGDYRGAHIIMRAELDGLICSGKLKNKKQTYALLDHRVPEINKISREEALAKLAGKYFTSHGPATTRDFSWWSGLSLKDSKTAIEIIKADFISEEIGTERYWFKGDLKVSEENAQSVFLLPAFDEYLISYRDRSAVLELVHHKKAVSDNGIFRPIVVINGQVAGLWKRSLKKGKLAIETQLFKKFDKKMLKALNLRVEDYREFVTLE